MTHVVGEKLEMGCAIPQILPGPNPSRTNPSRPKVVNTFKDVVLLVKWELGSKISEI